MYSAIISVELFKAVREEKRKRSNMTVRNNGHKGRKCYRYSNDTLFGKIICGECGANYRKITRNTKNGKTIVWRYANRVEHGSRVCKNSLTITNDEIQMKLAERLLLYQFDEEACRKYLKEIKSGADIVVTAKPFNENELLKLREYQMSRAAIKGDRKALDLLYEESYKKIRNFIKERLYRAGLHTYADLMRDYEDVCQDTFSKSFVILEKYLQRCIGVVAVMRPAIDPFPVLLMDEDVLYRCFDSMTNPYSEEFVKKYIGVSTLEEYKRTELYMSTYDSFAYEEKKNEATFNVMKHQYIDSHRLEEIFAQLHLLPKDDIISVLLVSSCEKAVKIYSCHGLIMYFTDRNTNRKAMSWSGLDFKKFSEAENPMNQPYDEAFISVFRFDDTPYFVEHNEFLTADEIGQMIETVVGSLIKNGN